MKKYPIVIFSMSAIALVAALALERCQPQATDLRGEPVGVIVRSTATPTTTPPATPTATVTPTLQPIGGDPVRVQFKRGSYGATITGTNSKKYLLWAAQGQTFTTTLTANSNALASLYAPNGKPLYEGLRAGYLVGVALPANGDYRLEVHSGGAYTAGVEIR